MGVEFHGRAANLSPGRLRAALPLGTPAYETLKAGVMSIWNNTVKHGDANGDGRCTLDEWMAMEVEVLSTEKNFQLYSLEVAKGIFDVLDQDGDGKLTAADWVNFFRAFVRQPEHVARESFGHLDVNGDGFLTKEEILGLVREFHFSSDPGAPGNWLFGRW